MKGIKLIENIRMELNKREVMLISDNEFSKQYLNRSRSYISVMKHKQLDISESALLALYRNLNGLSITLREIAESSSMSTSSRTWHNHLLFKRLSEVVLSDITAESIH